MPFVALAAAAYAVAAGAAWALSRGWITMSTVEQFPLCLFRLWTGLRCPGCGMGHAVLEAFQGHWGASFSSHALGLPLLAVWTAWLSREALARLRRRCNNSVTGGPYHHG